MKRCFKTGFALFELLLVMVLGGCVLLGSMQAYQRIAAERQRVKALQVVRILLIVAAEHFNDKPSVTSLIVENNVSKQMLNNALLDDFALTYSDRPARIICTARIKSASANQRVQLAKALGATLQPDGQQLEWDTTKSAVLQPVSHFWSMQAHLQGYINRVTHVTKS